MGQVEEAFLPFVYAREQRRQQRGPGVISSNGDIRG